MFTVFIIIVSRHFVGVRALWHTEPLAALVRHALETLAARTGLQLACDGTALKAERRADARGARVARPREAVSQLHEGTVL